jgi:Heparinase II/III-like protein/Heparinase II/III N-terminus
MNRLKTAYQILRNIGARSVAMRAGVYLHKSLGLTRRKFPARDWNSIALEEICSAGTPSETRGYAEFKQRRSVDFFFPLGRPPSVPDSLRGAPRDRQPALEERLRLIGEDRAIYCFRTPSPERIDWNANPLDSTSVAEADRVWCDIPDVAPGQGDIRLLWDPARAAWAFDVGRARSLGLKLDAGQLYWRWVDSWMSACPPWRGPHWKCGQEAAVRLIALSFAFWALADKSSATSDRWVQFARLAWATGYRIDRHLQYARSQKNNHALSEACGLMLVGHLFPEFRDSQRWFGRGHQVFQDELARQVYADGSYVQHSLNYHRVMLQMAVLAARIADWHGTPFSGATLERIAAAEEFLFQMLDETGRVPLYGNNDGALVLPLDECDFTDYRGAVQAAHYLVNGKRRLPPGTWDEDLLWLFGAEALCAPQQPMEWPQSTAFDDGGYYTLRGEDSWGMIRCHTFRDRPAHYDQLHFDLWHRGQNVLCDSGTYRYNPTEGRKLEDYFQLIGGHNTIELDGASPVERVSRFLFFPWPRAKVRHFQIDADGYRYFEGERYDYDAQPWHVLHRRAIVGLPDDLWLVIDDLLDGDAPLRDPFRADVHSATLRWHLPDVPVQLDSVAGTVAVRLPCGEFFVALPGDAATSFKELAIVRGRIDAGEVQGFRSPYYGERLANPVVEAKIRADLPQRLVSLFAPHSAPRWQMEHGATSQNETYELSWQGNSWRVELGRRARSTERIVRRIGANGAESTCASSISSRADCGSSS